MFLYKHFEKKIYILIDEYDAPINHISPDARVEVSLFIGNLLSTALKDNEYLEKGVIIGIMRLAKANIFSGLNNIEECTLLDSAFSQSFGFTEEEVISLINDQELGHLALASIKEWYNGYKIGDIILYNPWSIMSCIHNKGKLSSYWLDTADNEIIRQALQNADISVKQSLEQLIQFNNQEYKEEVLVEIDRYISFERFQHPTATWSLLFNSGYLTITHIELNADGEAQRYAVRIPNKEVRAIYLKYLKWWSQTAELQIQYNRFITHLIAGIPEEFKSELEKFLLNSFSYFDTGGKNPEKVYHAFVLGLVADLHLTYLVHSNKESGQGRYDVMLIPRDKNALGIILEFKSIDSNSSKENLEKETKEALQQIIENQCDSELNEHGIKNKLFVAITFAGKKVCLKHQSDIQPSFNANLQVEQYQKSKSPPSSPLLAALNTDSSITYNSNITTNSRKQLGWNCFDLAIELADRLTIADENEQKRSKLARQNLVQQALNQSLNMEFRQLLAPEIRHAAALTAIYLNMKDEENSDHAAENLRIIELFGVAAALTDKSDVDSVKKYIDSLLNHNSADKSDLLELERYTLPASIYNAIELKNMISAYDNAHESMKPAVATFNNYLGFNERQRRSLEELVQYCHQMYDGLDKAAEYQNFWTAYLKNFKPAEDVLMNFCLNQNIYENYIRDYYGNNGWFAFQRKFRGEKTTSMIDITARLLNITIAIYQRDAKKNQLKLLYLTEKHGKQVDIRYDGYGHFLSIDEQILDEKNQQISSKSIKRLRERDKASLDDPNSSIKNPNDMNIEFNKLDDTNNASDIIAKQQNNTAKKLKVNQIVLLSQPLSNAQVMQQFGLRNSSAPPDETAVSIDQSQNRSDDAVMKK